MSESEYISGGSTFVDGVVVHFEKLRYNERYRVWAKGVTIGFTWREGRKWAVTILGEMTEGHPTFKTRLKAGEYLLEVFKKETSW